MILSRAGLHDTVSCAAWNDAQKGVYLKPLFKTPCSNCYWGWSKPIMLDYRDISLMESVPLLWRTVTASPVGIEPMTILEGGGPYNWYLIHNVEKSTFSTGWPPNTPYDCAEARRTQVADVTFRDFRQTQMEKPIGPTDFDIASNFWAYTHLSNTYSWDTLMHRECLGSFSRIGGLYSSGYLGLYGPMSPFKSWSATSTCCLQS